MSQEQKGGLPYGRGGFPVPGSPEDRLELADLFQRCAEGYFDGVHPTPDALEEAAKILRRSIGLLAERAALASFMLREARFMYDENLSAASKARRIAALLDPDSPDAL